MSVSVRIQSSSATCVELTALAGRPPTRCAEVGSPVSSRNPAGPVFETTTWIARFDPPAPGHLDAALNDALGLVSRIRELSADASVDVVCRVDAKPLGNMIELAPATLAALATLDVSLILDVYDSDS